MEASLSSSEVNDKFLNWLKTKYASDNIGEIKAKRGKKHDYLAMTFDFTTPGVLKINMSKYIEKMIEEYPEKLSGKLKCPWSKNLFKVEESSPRLSEEKSKNFTLLL